MTIIFVAQRQQQRWMFSTLGYFKMFLNDKKVEPDPIGSFGCNKKKKSWKVENAA